MTWAGKSMQILHFTVHATLWLTCWTWVFWQLFCPAALNSGTLTLIWHHIKSTMWERRDTDSFTTVGFLYLNTETSSLHAISVKRTSHKLTLGKNREQFLAKEPDSNLKLIKLFNQSWQVFLTAVHCKTGMSNIWQWNLFTQVSLYSIQQFQHCEIMRPSLLL